jgi:hypothetical protein
MNLPNLPMSRWQRWSLVLLRKPVLWALMVCTSGATLMMVQSMADTNAPGWPKQAAKREVAGALAVSRGAASSAHGEQRPDDTER